MIKHIIGIGCLHVKKKVADKYHSLTSRLNFIKKDTLEIILWNSNPEIILSAQNVLCAINNYIISKNICKNAHIPTHKQHSYATIKIVKCNANLKKNYKNIK